MPLIAKATFAAAGHRVVKRGTVVPDDDPIVKGREALFKPVEDEVAKKTDEDDEPKKTTRRRVSKKTDEAEAEESE